MKILAIETSTSCGSVALAEDGDLLAERRFQSERSHNAQIFAPLGELLGDGIDGILVGTGPGSYTGVRIGIAAGMGIAMARGIPLAGIASTTAVDEAEGRYAVVGDARRGAFYWAVSDSVSLHSAEELSEKAAGWSGRIYTFDEVPPLPEAVPCRPSAAKMARELSGAPRGRLNELAAHPVEPIYLRAPFVTKPRKPGKAVPK